MPIKCLRVHVWNLAFFALNAKLYHIFQYCTAAKYPLYSDFYWTVLQLHSRAFPQQKSAVYRSVQYPKRTIGAFKGWFSKAAIPLQSHSIHKQYVHVWGLFTNGAQSDTSTTVQHVATFYIQQSTEWTQQWRLQQSSGWRLNFGMPCYQKYQKWMASQKKCEPTQRDESWTRLIVPTLAARSVCSKLTTTETYDCLTETILPLAWNLGLHWRK